ncbi:MAG: nuclear transport factor 2 family protein [Hyphomicrobiales bacterium]
MTRAAAAGRRATLEARASAAALVAALAGALLAAGCGTPAPPKVPPAAHFVALEQRWLEAIAAQDSAALDSLLTDDFLDVSWRGELRSKHNLTMMRMAGAPPKYRSRGLESLVVRQYGGAVIVTGVNVLQGADTTDVVRVRFTDVFVEDGGRWRAASAQETLEATP